MAFTSKSGDKYTNASQAKAADRRFGIVPIQGKSIGDGKQPVAQSNFSKPEPARQPTADQDPSQVVAEHGPAHTVAINHMGDTHTLTSTHPDGYVHNSKYDSAESAHDAGNRLAGIGNSDKQELPNLSDMM
jgi:hypothetical protein